ncbi:hypothetical protein BV20DRAFT_1006793 [Pilatotrama ljubarskyi]|nr:hypothetical protein BV20DRAFT_1006793 [Pilatotrama ljubarskyi]
MTRVVGVEAASTSTVNVALLQPELGYSGRQRLILLPLRHSNQASATFGPQHPTMTAVGESLDREEIINVPTWLQTHPELRRRGIVLVGPLKPVCRDGFIPSLLATTTLTQCLQSYVYRTTVLEVPVYAVKILEAEHEEAHIYERLRGDPKPQNHTIPFEIVHSEPELLIMPCLTHMSSLPSDDWPLSAFFALFLQIVEGVEYLHNQRIAHLDLCDGNVLVATERMASFDNRLTPGRIYIIDYHTSRQLPSGPGVHPPIHLPPTQIPPPLDNRLFDPYSWDVYCLGKLFERMVKLRYWGKPSPPWITRRITQWLVGDERGCADFWHRRPTARRARQVLTVVRWATWFSESVSKVSGWVRLTSTSSRTLRE